MMKPVDSFAETVNLGGGNTETQDGFGGGTVQTFAEMMPGSSRAPNQMAVFADQPMGTLERAETGTVPLKRQPHRGYESGTPQNSESENPGA